MTVEVSRIKFDGHRPPLQKDKPEQASGI